MLGIFDIRYQILGRRSLNKYRYSRYLYLYCIYIVQYIQCHEEGDHSNYNANLQGFFEDRQPSSLPPHPLQQRAYIISETKQ